MRSALPFVNAMAARRGPALLLVLAYACAKSSEFNRPVDLEALEASYDEADSEDWHEDSQRWRDRRTEAANARSLKAQVDAKLAEARGEAPPAEPRAAGRTTVQTWFAHLDDATAADDADANALAARWQAMIARGSVEMASVRVHDIKPTVFRVWFMGEDADDGLRAWVLAQPHGHAGVRMAVKKEAQPAALIALDVREDEGHVLDHVAREALLVHDRGGQLAALVAHAHLPQPDPAHELVVHHDVALVVDVGVEHARLQHVLRPVPELLKVGDLHVQRPGRSRLDRG